MFVDLKNVFNFPALFLCSTRLGTACECQIISFLIEGLLKRRTLMLYSYHSYIYSLMYVAKIYLNKKQRTIKPKILKSEWFDNMLAHVEFY